MQSKIILCTNKTLKIKNVVQEREKLERERKEKEAQEKKDKEEEAAKEKEKNADGDQEMAEEQPETDAEAGPKVRFFSFFLYDSFKTSKIIALCEAGSIELCMGKFRLKRC